MRMRFRLPFSVFHVDLLLGIALALLFAAGCAIKMVHPEETDMTERPDAPAAAAQPAR
jgi:hypothetical protein